MVEEAIRREYQVIALTRTFAKAKELQNWGAQVVPIDLSNPKELEDLLKRTQPDYFIHNAGVTKLTKQTKEDYVQGNVQLTKDVIDAIQKVIPQLKKFIFTSSLEAGGPGDAKTLKPKKIDEPRPPVTAYGQSKLLAEKIIQQQDKIPYIIFRPTAVYGSGDRGLANYFRLVKAHFQPYFISDRQLLSFIYVKDLAALYLDALETPIKNKIYYVSDGQVYTAKEFGDWVKTILGVSTMRLVFPKALLKIISGSSELLAHSFGIPNFFSKERFRQISEPNWSCDISETINDFNFAPAYDLESGLRETLDEYRHKV